MKQNKIRALLRTLEGAFDSPVPGFSSQDVRLLSQLVQWADEADSKAAASLHAPRPTTKHFSDHFGFPHERTLDLISSLERRGLVVKKRQRSSGVTGNGYDGALHSSVEPTDKARQFIASLAAPVQPTAE